MANNTKMNFSSASLYPVLLFTISLNLVLSSAVRTTLKTALPSSLHIVYTSERLNNVRDDTFNLKILASVLGSNEAAKEALVYSFKNSISGFAAKLTPEQVKKISEQPGVVHVAKSVSYNLTQGRNIRNNV